MKPRIANGHTQCEAQDAGNDDLDLKDEKYGRAATLFDDLYRSFARAR